MRVFLSERPHALLAARTTITRHIQSPKSESDYNSENSLHVKC